MKDLVKVRSAVPLVAPFSRSGVDVPSDDPLHNGTRQHDEAVGELQGETVGDLPVEAHLSAVLRCFSCQWTSIHHIIISS